MGVALDSLTCLSLNVHNNLTCEKWADILPFSTEPAKVLKDRNTGNKNTDRKKTFQIKNKHCFHCQTLKSCSGVMLTSRFTIGHVKRNGQITVKSLWDNNYRRKCLFIDGLNTLSRQ